MVIAPGLGYPVILHCQPLSRRYLRIDTSYMQVVSSMVFATSHPSRSVEHQPCIVGHEFCSSWSCISSKGEPSSIVHPSSYIQHFFCSTLKATRCLPMGIPGALEAVVATPEVAPCMGDVGDEEVNPRNIRWGKVTHNSWTKYFLHLSDLYY